MPEQINSGYQVSSEGAVRHWEVPYARLDDATPTPTNPAMMTAVLAGAQVCGTILTIDAGTSTAIIDFTCSMVYQFTVRNVLTYAAAVEATWGAMNVGDRVYYDNSATMPAGTYLSVSPLNNAVAANPIFGTIVLNQDEVAADFPQGVGGVASTQTLAIMQRGAGA